MLTITTSQEWLNEKEYVFNHIFNDALGLDYQISISQQQSSTTISHDNKQCIIHDFIFTLPPHDRLTSRNNINPVAQNYFPSNHHLKSVLTEESIPILFHNPNYPIGIQQPQQDSIIINMDLFGLCFVMLSNLEEINSTQKDEHSRIPANKTLAYKYNFLHRPIVDEYIEILWVCLKMLMPNLIRKKLQFRIQPTHDVDFPFLYLFSGCKTLIKETLRPILHKKNLIGGIKQPFLYFLTKYVNESYDPYNTFARIMGISERANLVSRFYFMTEFSNNRYETPYPLTHSSFKKLFQQINYRHHEIGLHTSYASIEHSISTEFKTLKERCNESNVFQERWGARQHYLRWDPAKMPALLNEAGVDHDSSLSPIGNVGFRNGTCRPFQLYDFTMRKQSGIIEYPLHIMDVNLFSPHYLNLDHHSAYDVAHKIKKHCQKYSGVFTLLWHNSFFQSQLDFEFYQALL